MARFLVEKYQRHSSSDIELPFLLEERLQHMQQQFEAEWLPLLSQADEEKKGTIGAAQQTLLQEKLSFERRHFLEAWSPILQWVAQLRREAYKEFAPIWRKEQPLTTDWFIETLSKHRSPPRVKQGEERAAKPLTDQTVWRWKNRGLLFYQGWDRPDFDSAMAVYMMLRAEPGARKGFLPSGDYADEPYMFCWRQDTPSSPLVPCGLPLNAERDKIPKHALLYSPLPSLAHFHRTWLPFEHFSVRWAGTLEEDGLVMWDLSEEEIAMWDDAVIPLGHGVLDSIAKQIRHTLANLALLRVATRQLGVSPS
jgi:hypothetical protein